MARETRPAGPVKVDSYEHGETRQNIPTADAAEEWFDETDAAHEPVVFPREVEFADERAARNASLDPQLVWRGKDAQDATDLVVEAPPIYIQEKIDPRVLVENLRKTAAAGEVEPEVTLFDGWDGGLDELERIEFYQHPMKWQNRMVLGDSLQVMTSLSEREQLRGQVQMIYIDPPYGIKFGSNWQVSARKRDVKDGKLEDAAREAEQIKAFRDTWEDGIHTYLSYLRDRLVAARDLLTESGSVFVQIGDENVHLVRALLDEVFGAENFVSQIAFTKTGGMASDVLGGVYDLVLWYAKSASQVKSRRLFLRRTPGGIGASGYTLLDLNDGTWRPMSREERHDTDLLPRGSSIFDGTPLVSGGATATGSSPFVFNGKIYQCPPNRHWSTTTEGMTKLGLADRIIEIGRRIEFKRFFEDFALQPYDNLWTGMGQRGFTGDLIYVVQTDPRVIERCLLMTTDPGDLVLDPTCGSGTTAYVAEQWGRRWITIDTSRVALALARQRLMGGRYPYYLLADSPEGRRQEGVASGAALPPAETHGDIRRGFVYERVQHITLKSIANNPDIVEGMSRDEIDAAIKRHAEFELLYDKPYEDKKRVRVTGPFTVESLSPSRSLSFGDREVPASEVLADDDPAGADFAQTVLDSLRASGIQNGRIDERIRFASLDPYAGVYVQAMGERASDDADTAPGHVAIALGPQYGTVSASFIKEAAREALKDPAVDLLCVLGFAFEPNASRVTEADGVTLDTGDAGFAQVAERKLGRLKVLMVRMNAELLIGDALKKTGAGNLFTVFGEPDVEIRAIGEQLQVEIHGVDVYDPTTGQVRSRQTDRIALWMVDTDYDDESFFVRQCYFTGGNEPMKKLERALKADIDADAWASLYRTVSLPFDPPSTGKIAIKVINDYGDEVMKVYDVASAPTSPAT